jgi:hypothetical protein
MIETETKNPVRPNEILSKIISKIIESEDVRELILGVVKEELMNWSGDSRVKETLSKSIEKMITKALTASPSTNKNKGIAQDIGRLLTAWAQHVNETHRKPPVAQGSKEELHNDPVNDFIISTDFGEIKEMVDGSEEHILKILEAINNTIWAYPGKVVSLLASIITAANISIKGGNTLIKPMLHYLGPDLTADVLLSSLRELDGKEVGKLINSLGELIRRLHTGSLLLGKGDAPLFQIYLSKIFEEAVPEIDREIFTKAIIALAEDKETITRSFVDLLGKNVPFVLTVLSNYASIKNPKIRAASHKLRMYEEDIEPLKLADAIEKGTADLDTQGIAQLINRYLGILNELHKNKPELVFNLFKGFVEAIDRDEFEKTVTWAIPEFITASMPILTTALPHLLNGFCEIVKSEEGEDIRKAFVNLRDTIFTNGGNNGDRRVQNNS